MPGTCHFVTALGRCCPLQDCPCEASTHFPDYTSEQRCNCHYFSSIHFIFLFKPPLSQIGETKICHFKVTKLFPELFRNCLINIKFRMLPVASSPSCIPKPALISARGTPYISSWGDGRRGLWSTVVISSGWLCCCLPSHSHRGLQIPG